MKRIVIQAPAKINWTLDVLSKRHDGYHEVEMVMQSVALYDRITITERQKGISVVCNISGVPSGKDNIAYEAAYLLKSTFKIESGVDICIEKKIPVAAGMAGGSTDAAAVLIGLNRMWNLGLSINRLMELGKRLGADVPFCIGGGTALARGIGDILHRLAPAEDIWLVLVKPSFGVLTREVYSRLKLDRIRLRPDTRQMIKCLARHDLYGIGKNMVNVLEEVTVGLYPVIGKIKLDILKQGALGSMMTGSGPTVYGLFRDRKSAEKACFFLRSLYEQVYIARTCGAGAEIVEED